MQTVVGFEQLLGLCGLESDGHDLHVTLHSLAVDDGQRAHYDGVLAAHQRLQRRVRQDFERDGVVLSVDRRARGRALPQRHHVDLLSADPEEQLHGTARHVLPS